MIRSYLELPLVDGGADVLEEVFRRHQILETSVAQPGCRSAELTIDDETGTAVITALWEDRAAYDAWTARSDRGDLAAELQPALRTQLDASTVGRVFEVRHTG